MRPGATRSRSGWLSSNTIRGVVACAHVESRCAGLLVPNPELRQIDAGSVLDRAHQVVGGHGLAVMALEIKIDAAATRLPVSMPGLLLGVWLVGVILLSARMLLSAAALRRQVADRTPIRSGPVFDRLRTVSERAGLSRLPEGPLQQVKDQDL